MMETSLRRDISDAQVPSYVRLKEGISYPIDDYSYKHYESVRQPAILKLQQELQR